MKEPVLIETQNASIDTLSVTIRSLHVNSKQMTLAVFRQLPVVPVYRYDGTLVPLERWGLVRYEIKNEGSLWLVASHAGVLYRGNVWGFRYDFTDEELRYKKARIARLQNEFVEYKRWESSVLQYQADMESYNNQRRELEAICPIKPSRGSVNFGEMFQWVNERSPKCPQAVLERDFSDHRILYQWTVGLSQEYEEGIAGNGEDLKVMEAANRSYKELMALPQLFIAV